MWNVWFLCFVLFLNVCTTWNPAPMIKQHLDPVPSSSGPKVGECRTSAIQFKWNMFFVILYFHSRITKFQPERQFLFQPNRTTPEFWNSCSVDFLLVKNKSDNCRYYVYGISCIKLAQAPELFTNTVFNTIAFSFVAEVGCLKIVYSQILKYI